MITTTRNELHALVAGIPGAVVHRTVPEQIAPPCYVMQPGDRFVAEPDDGAATFAEPFVITFELLLLVDLGDENDNEQASDQLDGMIDALIEQLAGSAWWIDSMGRPGGLLTTDWIAHGQRVTVQRRITL